MDEKTGSAVQIQKPIPLPALNVSNFRPFSKFACISYLQAKARYVHVFFDTLLCHFLPFLSSFFYINKKNSKCA